MFSHVVVGTRDLKKSKQFYDALLATLGYGQAMPRDAGGYVYPGGDSFFIISAPRNGQEATAANGGTVGFACKSAAEVESWHAAGVANGGLAVEDPPGERNNQFGSLYLAYLRDPDGNKLCALYRL